MATQCNTRYLFSKLAASTRLVSSTDITILSAGNPCLSIHHIAAGLLQRFCASTSLWDLNDVAQVMGKRSSQRTGTWPGVRGGCDYFDLWPARISTTDMVVVGCHHYAFLLSDYGKPRANPPFPTFLQIYAITRGRTDATSVSTDATCPYKGTWHLFHAN